MIEAEGIINRNGFNNNGIDYLIENVKKARYKGVIGINIGKNKFTPLEQGKDDYIFCLNKAYNYAGYITVNISSPNTPDLRQLQYGDYFDDLLRGIKDRQTILANQYNKYVPIAIKIAPDLTESELVQIADTLLRHKMDGVIATNTTVSRDTVMGMKNAEQQGGLSGKPLQHKSTEIIKRLHQELKGQIPIIGSGGIDGLQNAQEKIEAGAELLQVYSGLIYHGPKLVKELVKILNNDKKYDLHCHSTASDGVLSPTELVYRAYAQGVNVLALCDHDTIAGIDEAEIAAKEVGIELITGVEISTNWEGRGIHIVGLNFDKTHPKMTALLQSQKALREKERWKLAIN